MRAIFIALITLSAFPCFGQAASESRPGQVHAYTLTNGMKVLVKEDHRAPVAVSMVWYNVGSADEKGGHTGLSHALEHIMFKGTPKYPLGVFSKTIASLGGQENAFTSNDYTAYFEKIDAKQIDKALEMEADRMQNLLLDANEFAREIKVIREERRMRTDDNPQSLTFERLLASAHLASPYHHPVIGWMNDLQQMTVEDLKAWYKLYYAPNNATLVVVGDVDPQAIYQKAQQYFGSLKASQLPERKFQQEPPALGKKSLTVKAPAKMPMLMMSYTVPSAKQFDQAYEPYALELIGGILDAGDSAHFAKDLVRGAHVASNIDIYYNLFARYQTQFVIYGTPSPDHSLDELRQGIQKQLDQLQSKPIDPLELQRVKNQIIAQKTFEKDSIFGQAMELGMLETVGLGWQTSESYIESINQITPQQIQDTAKKYFQERLLTEATLFPLTQAEANA